MTQLSKAGGTTGVHLARLKGGGREGGVGGGGGGFEFERGWEEREE